MIWGNNVWVPSNLWRSSKRNECQTHCYHFSLYHHTGDSRYLSMCIQYVCWSECAYWRPPSINEIDVKPQWRLYVTLRQLSHRTDTYADIQSDWESIIAVWPLNFHSCSELAPDISQFTKKWKKKDLWEKVKVLLFGSCGELESTHPQTAGSVIWFPALSGYMLKCPWARHWIPSCSLCV